MRLRFISAGLSLLGDIRLMLAAAVVVAAPVWADTAQEEAAAAIGVLSYTAAQSGGMGEMLVPPIFVVDEFRLLGCVMVASRSFKVVGSEGFIFRVGIDLSKDDYAWVDLSGETGLSKWALTFTADEGGVLQTLRRDETEVAAFLNNFSDTVEPIEVIDRVEEFALQVPVPGTTTAGQIVYLDTPGFDRNERLKTALDDYVSDWCR
jgi:hypothetical protein